MRQGIAYKLTFPNGKVYIGITRETLDRRVKRHIAYAKAGKHFALSAAIRKYGEDSFARDVVGTGDWNELKEIEIKLIAQYGSLGSGGYNMTSGGDGSLGVAVPDSVKGKISNSLKGRKLSNDHRKKLSESQIGKIISAETKEKMRLAAIGRVVTDAQKNKVSDSLRGRKQSQELIAKRVAARMTKGKY